MILNVQKLVLWVSLLLTSHSLIVGCVWSIVLLNLCQQSNWVHLLCNLFKSKENCRAMFSSFMTPLFRIFFVRIIPVAFCSTIILVFQTLLLFPLLLSQISHCSDAAKVPSFSQKLLIISAPTSSREMRPVKNLIFTIKIQKLVTTVLKTNLFYPGVQFFISQSGRMHLRTLNCYNGWLLILTLNGISLIDATMTVTLKGANVRQLKQTSLIVPIIRKVLAVWHRVGREILKKSLMRTIIVTSFDSFVSSPLCFITDWFILIWNAGKKRNPNIILFTGKISLLISAVLFIWHIKGKEDDDS